MKAVTFEEYSRKAPEVDSIHYWDLHPQLCIGFPESENRVKMRGKTMTIRKLGNMVGHNYEIERSISHICSNKQLKRKLRISLPVSLQNENYVRLYSLMLSEGSTRTEFRLHVPENEFHNLFMEALQNLLGKDIIRHITRVQNKGIDRSTAPAISRYMVPIPQHIPRFILKNREFCREYLRVAFEAEGSPIFVGSKRYISLKRNVDVTHLFENEIKYRVGRRVYKGILKRDYPKLIEKLECCPPPPLLGEHLIMLKHFDIHSILKLEAIRVNNTSHRCGKISARWALYIYADSVNRFINEIGFLTRRKRSIAKRMLKIGGRRRRFFTVDILKKLERGGVIKSSDFVREMRDIGYVSPRAYLCRYLKNGILRRRRRGEYVLAK